MTELLLLTPLAPLLTALLLLWNRPKLAYGFVLSCLPALALGLYPVADLSLGFLWPGAHWGLTDPVNRLFLLLTASLWALAGLFAASSQRQDPHWRRFWCFWLLTLSGNLLLIIARDPISFYLGFTLMSLCAYGLVAHLPGPGPRRAGRLYLQLAVLGEMLLYAGFMLRLHETQGSLDLSLWQQQPMGGWTAFLLFLGFGLKAGFWPLHVWLPLAHPAAPAAASAVLSGVMLKAGILGLWQFLPSGTPWLTQAAPWLFALGLYSAFFGIAMGLLQSRIKVLLAYSSISQMGYLLIILSAAWRHPDASLAWGMLLALYALHHGLAKGSLFLAAGLAAQKHLRPWHWYLLCLPALALAGLPLTSGALAKIQLKNLLGQTDFEAWLGLVTLGSGATALLVFRALWLFRSQLPISPKATAHWGQGAWLPLALAVLVLPWTLPQWRDTLFYSLELRNVIPLIAPLALAGLVAIGFIWRQTGLPAKLRDCGSPAPRLSLALSRSLLAASHSTARRVVRTKPGFAWRHHERRWNRFWFRQNTPVVSAWLICVVICAGWLISRV